VGTSKGYGGPSDGLVPSWADSPAAPPAGPGDGSPPARPPGGPPNTPQNPLPGRPPGRAPIAPSGGAPGPLTGARTKFTRFAQTGSRSDLGGAVQRYVGATGGAVGASRRMGATRAAGVNLLGIVGDAYQAGLAEALRRRGLGDLVGRPAEEVLLGLLDFACPPGGPIDEGISRQAMLEAINQQAEAGVANFDEISPAALRELFLDFIICSIEGKIISDIGTQGLRMPADPQAVLDLESQLRDFIAGATRTYVGAMLDGSLAGLQQTQLMASVTQIYEVAFELVRQEGEESE
jgi:hypothetical protein